MTRKDFLFLAAALKKARPALPWTGPRGHLYAGWEAAVRGVADDIAAQTRAFNVGLFLQNAGVVTKPPSESCVDIAAEIARMTGKQPRGERQ